MTVPDCPKCDRPVEKYEVSYPYDVTILPEETLRPDLMEGPIHYRGPQHHVARCHGETWAWDGPVGRCAEMYAFLKKFCDGDDLPMRPRDPPAPPKVDLHLYLPEDLVGVLRRLADRECRSWTKQAEFMLRRAIAEADDAPT